MINNKKILVIIPARGGSKGVHKKNIKILNGKPLIQYSIDVAKKSRYVDKIVVSTDCSEIANVALGLGSEIIERPSTLSQDLSLVKDAIQYTVNELEKNNNYFEYIFLLEPTSPLRTIKELELCIKILARDNFDSIATFSNSCISPGRLWKIENNKLTSYIEGSNPWLPRQQQPIAYELNGLIYGFTRKSLKEYKDSNSILVGKIGPVISENYVIDIDDEIDFIVAEKIMEIKNERT